MENNSIKFPSFLLLLTMCMMLFVSPAFAFNEEGDALPNKVNTTWADSEETESSTEAEPTTGGVEPGQTEPPSESSGTAEALTPEGDLTLVDDIRDDTGEDKQFLTVATRNGHYFYLIVDRAKHGENNVHFLNPVDESDLLAIIEDKEQETTPAVCDCSDKCYPGLVNTSCPVCAVNMSECTGKEPEPEQTETPEKTEKPEQTRGKTGINPIPAILALVVLIASGAVYLLKFRKQKADTKGSADLEDYDYGDTDEPEISDKNESEDE